MDPLFENYFAPEPPVSSTPNLVVYDTLNGHLDEQVDLSTFMLEPEPSGHWLASDSNQFYSSLSESWNTDDICRDLQESLAF